MEGAMVSSLAKLDATPLAGHTDVGGKGVLVGTDAGQLLRISGGASQELFNLEGDWIEAIAVHEDKALRAFSARRTLVVLDADGETVLNEDSHPSTLTGISFSPDGAWIAVAHYGGVTVWNLDAPGSDAVHLEWHGSHTAVAWSPNGTYIVTAMQDKEMHCWRWSDRKGMRMSGYPSKIRNISWTADSRFIAASGADSVTSWDCSNNGLSGKPPLEFGYVYNGIVRQVAAHPTDSTVAGGYSDGTVMIGNIEQETAMIARPGGGKPVAGLVWSPDGKVLVAVDEVGAIAVMRLRSAMV
jgi:WD40 repeat protein